MMHILAYAYLFVMYLILMAITANWRAARREKCLAKRASAPAKVKENIKAIQESYRKIRIEDKIALLSLLVVFVLAALALWFFLG